MAGEAIPSGGFQPVLAGCGGMSHGGSTADCIADGLPKIGRLFPIFVLLTNEGLRLDHSFVVSSRFESIPRLFILADFQQRVAAAYGVGNGINGFGLRDRRASLLIDTPPRRGCCPPRLRVFSRPDPSLDPE